MKKAFFLLLLTSALGCQTIHSVGDLSWQLRLERALGDDAPPRDDGLCPSNSPIRLQWEERANAATPGMTRSEVEKILPFYDFPEKGPHPAPGRVTVNNVPRKGLICDWYYVAEDFIAVFVYEDSAPTDMPLSGPGQPLVARPMIIHYDFTYRFPK